MTTDQREKKAESCRRWRERHPLTDDQKKERSRKSKEWREKHPGYDQIRWISQKSTMSPEKKEKRLEYNRKYKKTHPEVNAEWIERHPECGKEYAWRWAGIDWSYDKFLEMFKSQDGKCLGCECELAKSRKEKKEGMRLANLDHDHATGKVRGILCSHCNQALGNVFDNANTLIRLSEYVEKHSGQ